MLVTQFNPLKVYIYNDGLVRFATEKYNLDPKRLNEKFVHLTNFSINKKNTKFVKNNDQRHGNEGDSSDGEGGAELQQDSSKWDFKMLASAYAKMGVNYGHIFNQMKDVILKTLMSVETVINSGLQKNPTNRNNCFELYGFDILIDATLKPWILEVNVLPSLSSSSVFDKRIKTMVVCDALTLVGIRGYDKQKFHTQNQAMQGLAPF